MKKLFLLLSFCLLMPTQAMAEKLILTVSETENGHSNAWWPDFKQSPIDQALSMALTSYGLELVRPKALIPSPRLSPVVYGLVPLSDTNAKSLASLFGSTHVLNGQVTWHCESQSMATRCCAASDLKLITAKGPQNHFTQDVCAYAPDVNTAKMRAIQILASQIVHPIDAELSTSDSLPQLFHKPVIVLDGMPDADTLVSLRKLLKLSPGIDDVAEIWIANGRLAIEINPQMPVQSAQEFYLAIDAFLAAPKEGLIVREAKRSDVGIVLEIMSE